ncbi:hypothetical protein BDZ89DRAFT_1090916 [Hymenopellis radicata]|nr:hypothetical protein BDZ89DRAFT_1090916 [Hymenopellis radicata]
MDDDEDVQMDYSDDTPASNSPRENTEYHPFVNGKPCDKHGNILPDGTPPPPFEYERPIGDWFPFDNRRGFELADLLYRRNQAPADHIKDLLQIWAADLPPDQDPPFMDAKDMYDTIDLSTLGSVPWDSFNVSYDGELPKNRPPEPWMTAKYDVWFRDPREVLHQQLSNQDFAQEMDFAPKRVTDKDGRRRYQDFMSGNWAWRQADLIAQDPNNHDTTFVPTICGSDKTTVSVATGQNEYWPLYMSNGLIHNNVRRAHRNGVTLLGFLAIPKTDREHHDSEEFRRFRRQLFHGSLSYIMQSLKPGMTTPEVVRYADGHYRRTLYGLGPFIGDYPEQVLLACIVQGWCARCTAHRTNLDGAAGRRTHEHTEMAFECMSSKDLWNNYGIVDGILPFTHEFPRADIHELLSPDLLHQIIKGTFKDHLITWIEDYIKDTYPKKEASQILADIDRRIAVVPSFSGLRRFPEGRAYKQWTGDDSKALMKVILPAISGHVPDGMVRALAAFMEFCYIVRRSVLDEDDLVALDDALARYHQEREVFRTLGVVDSFSLPRQHSMVHYRRLIQEFGAPNGLCSSITESKHIKAVKEPWRRSSRFEALMQMLTINERLDKLAAMRVYFRVRGMLANSLFGPLLPVDKLPTPDGPTDEDDDGGDADSVQRKILGEVKLAKKPCRLSSLFDTGYHRLPELIRRFLYEQTTPDPPVSPDNVDLNICPRYVGKVFTYPSAVAEFYAPSDLSGIGGMRRERIRAAPRWRKGPARYDCVFAEADSELPGFRGMHVARVLLFMSLRHENVQYPCALVTWFSAVGDEPDPDTGLWKVVPDLDHSGDRFQAVIHLDCLLRGAHLIGRPEDDEFIPRGMKHTDSLDLFTEFYVNKYADHHSHEIAF